MGIFRRKRDDRAPAPIPPTSYTNTHELAALLGIEIPANKVVVTEQNVTGIVAVQAGVDMVSHAVGTMMSEAKCFNERDEEIDVPPVIAQPSKLYSPFEFYSNLVDITMKRGNGIATFFGFDADGLPTQVVPVHPDACSLDDSSGIPFLTVNNERVEWDECIHVRHGAPWGSLWGQGIVERHRNPLSLMLYENEWIRSSYEGGGAPTVVIGLDKDTVTNTESEQVQQRYIDRRAGGQNLPLVTGKLMKIETLTWKPEDMEWCESQKVSVGKAALMCGLDPMDLGTTLGSSMVYANLNDAQLSRVLRAFNPWMKLVEEAMSNCLPPGCYVRGNVEALLRSTTKERFEIYEIGKRIGIYTDEELRELERRPKLPEKPEPPVVVVPPPPPDPTADVPEEGEAA